MKLDWFSDANLLDFELQFRGEQGLRCWRAHNINPKEERVPCRGGGLHLLRVAAIDVGEVALGGGVRRGKGRHGLRRVAVDDVGAAGEEELDELARGLGIGLRASAGRARGDSGRLVGGTPQAVMASSSRLDVV